MKSDTINPNGTYWGLLRERGFTSFLITQFLGAWNDNAYKITVSLLTVMLVADPRRNSAYLSLAGFLFVLPFVLFSGYAGQLADRYSKRSVLIITKLLEMPAMALGLWAFFRNDPDWMLAVVFVMALQSTFFGPAKYGILPEILPEKELSRANGLLEMSTFAAIILGTVAAGFLFEAWAAATWKIGLVLVGVAALGSLTSFTISKSPTPRAPQPFQWNPAREVWEGTRVMWKDRALLLTITGISFFWFLGALFQMDLLLFAKDSMQLTDSGASLLVAGLAIGIGTGSMELGLVMPGCLGMGLSGLAVIFTAPDFWLTLGCLAIMGFCGGLFIVPLNAMLQHKPAAHEKGRLMGVNNFYNAVAMLMASAALATFTSWLGLSPATVIIFASVFTVAIAFVVFWFTAQDVLRFALGGLLRIIYRFRVQGADVVPAHGPALLFANHVSYLDGFLIGACIPRIARFLIMDAYYERFRWVLAPIGAIPVPLGRRAVLESIAAARQALERGELVCIFPEGSLTRTGNIHRFQRGMERIVEGLNVPVIPVHLGGVWGSRFSHGAKGRPFYRRGVWRRTVQVTFGQPLPHPVSAEYAREQVLSMAADAMAASDLVNTSIARRLLKNCRRYWNREALADSSGKKLTYGRTLTAAILLAGWLRKNRLAEERLGLLLPASVGGALANLATLLCGKVPVNLNFTSGSEAIRSACTQCDIRTVLSSRIFLKKAKLEEPEGVVYLEDLLPAFSGVAKAIALLRARLSPQGWLLRSLGASHVKPDDVATIIFSSGSSGEPKGVMLSHRGILANIEGGQLLFHVRSSDVIGGILPLFHSFGFTYTLCFPLMVGARVAYHPNPLDAKMIGELAAKHKISILLATPTFLRNYWRVCTPEQFASLRLVITGAEKLPAQLATDFQEKFGVTLYEGYGATEMSPVISVNVPNAEHPLWPQPGNKPGTVGQPIPGVRIKVVDPDTLEPVGTGKQGLILSGGPSRMLGYWKQEDRTASAMRDGWYITGDIGSLDADGFLSLTDRLSRFSKIAGEMVPLIRVEEAVREHAGIEHCVVVALPDPQKGERLVLLHTDPEKEPAHINRAVAATGMSRLWIPKAESIYRIDQLPILPTGKLDLRRVKALAAELEGNQRHDATPVDTQASPA
jgi:acyl-[acyl-carrier-protein]-phospholipid O-acyltransferase/long-chain-fatty-acid--[acyl-carrier-protein] ligase